MKFLLDTSFLVNAVKFKIDIIFELTKFGKPEIYTIDLVVKELERLAQGKSRDGSAAKVCLSLIKNAGIIKSSAKNADSGLELLSKRFVVCTQDKELSDRIKSKGASVVMIRQKKYLVIL
jgi:rRNA-processing protein FCF1